MAATWASNGYQSGTTSGNKIDSYLPVAATSGEPYVLLKGQA